MQITQALWALLQGQAALTVTSFYCVQLEFLLLKLENYCQSCLCCALLRKIWLHLLYNPPHQAAKAYEILIRLLYIRRNTTPFSLSSHTCSSCLLFILSYIPHFCFPNTLRARPLPISVAFCQTPNGLSTSPQYSTSQQWIQNFRCSLRDARQKGRITAFCRIAL